MEKQAKYIELTAEEAWDKIISGEIEEIGDEPYYFCKPFPPYDATVKVLCVAGWDSGYKDYLEYKEEDKEDFLKFYNHIYAEKSKIL